MSELDMDDVADAIYGEKVHENSTLHLPEANLAQPLPELNAANKHWRDALRNAELSASEGSAITSLVRRHLKAPPTAAQQAEWMTESSQTLAQRHGPAEARARLAAAKVLMQRDSRFAHTLAQAGLVNHPRVVSAMAERAHSLKAEGKL